jgi:hypothetical protein
MNAEKVAPDSCQVKLLCYLGCFLGIIQSHVVSTGGDLVAGSL